MFRCWLPGGASVEEAYMSEGPHNVSPLGKRTTSSTFHCSYLLPDQYRFIFGEVRQSLTLLPFQYAPTFIFQLNRFAPIFSFRLLVLLPQEACGSLPWRWPHELVTRRLKGPWTCCGAFLGCAGRLSKKMGEARCSPYWA